MRSTSHRGGVRPTGLSPLARTGLVSAVSLVGFVLGAHLGLARALAVSCPAESGCLTLEELRDGAALPEAVRVYDRTGTLVAEVAGPRRRALPLARIPERLAEAFVAVEDRRFWSHEGVDARGAVRAAVRNLVDGDITEGASTIPMQLVRTLWAESLSGVSPWRRKAMEARQAPRLIEELGHRRVLELYMNAIYLGDGVYGVERAARHYFGVGVDRITLGQMATLVGMARAPERYDPRRFPDRARQVRDVVLALLVEDGVIDVSEAKVAVAEDLGVTPLEADPPSGRSHFTAAVMRALRRTAPELSPYWGLAVHTTLDPGVQAAAEEALLGQLVAIEEGRRGELQAGAGPDEVLEGAAVALDTRTSAVLAWVGGRDFRRSEFDRVEQARRQVASLVKPFLVALAMERGYGMVDLVPANRASGGPYASSWLPADHVIDAHIPLREALVRSSNRAAVHLAMDMGIERLSDFAHRIGLDEPVAELPSSAIGTFSASLLDMTNAYTLFGDGGVRSEPHLIRRIEGWDGRLLRERREQTRKRVIDQTTAFVVLDAMRDVVDRGTGASIRAHGFTGTAAGKTGTTDDGRDAWFVGLTPEVTAGVWIGFDRPRTIVEDATGGDLAAPVWARWMQAVTEDDPRRSAWTPPLTVERIRYHPVYGDVIGTDCPISPGSSYRMAWVVRRRYDRTVCPSKGIVRRMEQVWRSIAPEGLVPFTPTPR